MPAARLVVRATVASVADRAGFDAWYRAEHMPDAMKAFGVATAMRELDYIARLRKNPTKAPVERVMPNSPARK